MNGSIMTDGATYQRSVAFLITEGRVVFVYQL